MQFVLGLTHNLITTYISTCIVAEALLDFRARLGISCSSGCLTSVQEQLFSFCCPTLDVQLPHPHA